MNITKVEAIPFGVPIKNFADASEFTELSLLKDNILKHKIEIVDGCVKVPEGPGFGVELDEETFEKYKILKDHHHTIF